jgi:phage terminase large subunit
MAGQRVTIPYRPRNWAKPFHAWLGRWAVLVLHRRAGKTTGVVNHHQRAALDDGWETRRLRNLMPGLTDAQLKDLLNPPTGRHYGQIMPTYKQAKLVVWDMLKFYARAIPGVGFNEQELLVRYPNGHKLQLFGADNPDSLRGIRFAGLGFDEYSQHPPNSFGEVLSKSLADSLGYAIFTGTIKGKNHLWKMHDAAKGDPAWFALWQDVSRSLATEDDVATRMIEQSMIDDRALIAKGLMTQAEYDQEWFLSPDAAIKGAWFGNEMAAALREGRITRVPYDPALPVDTDWDLGIDDSTTIWFSQSLRSREIRLIDYYEMNGEGLPHYVKVLRGQVEKGEHLAQYLYGKHFPPHDIAVRELGTGKSRLETAGALGLKFEDPANMPKLELADGINAARLLLARCWFDETRCAHGIECLRNYKKTWNEKLGQFTGVPVHDWASHGADAYRGLAVRHQPPKEAQKDTPSTHQYDEGSQSLQWMS